MKTMKRHLSILTLGLIAAISVSCGGPTLAEKAANWIVANTDNIICADPERHSLYFFDYKVEDSYYSPRIAITKVDLLTEQAQPLAIYPNKEKEEPEIKYYLIPEDRGVNNPEATFVLGTRNLGLLYNTKTEKFSTICTGDFLYVHGKYLVCCNGGNSYYSTGFADISAYDVTGARLQDYRRFVGSIAKQEVVVDINIGDKGHIVGSYYYAKYAKGGNVPERLLLDGYVADDNSLVIYGYNTYGSRTETWSGVLVGNTISAEFENHYTGRTYDFTLVEQM